jgi:hypothetical protein
MIEDGMIIAWLVHADVAGHRSGGTVTPALAVRQMTALLRIAVVSCTETSAPAREHNGDTTRCILQRADAARRGVRVYASLMLQRDVLQ